MAIKFESKKDEPSKPSGTTKAQTAARFATPIEATDPVNPDPESELPFGKPPKPEKKARKAVKR